MDVEGEIYALYDRVAPSDRSSRTNGVEVWRLSQNEEPVQAGVVDAGGGTHGLAAVNQHLYFVVGFPNSANTLWTSSTIDGQSAPLGEVFVDAGLIRVEAALGESIILSATSSESVEIWKYQLDDTPDSSDFSLLAEVEQGSGNLFVDDFIALGDSLFFVTGNHTSRESSLWRTDGTPQGTERVERDSESLINVDVAGVFNDELVLRATVGEDERTMTISQDGVFADLAIDGVVGATTEKALYAVRGKQLLMIDAQMQETLVWESQLDFRSASDRGFQFSSREREETVITNDDVVVVMDTTGSHPSDQDRAARTFRVHTLSGQKATEALLFEYDDGNGPSWWITDGTESGTRQYFQRYPIATRSSFPEIIGRAGDTLFFKAFDGESFGGIWTTDGTSRNTRQLTNQVAFRYARSVGDVLFFRSEQPEGAPRLWISDGTVVGTRPVEVSNLATGLAVPRLLTPDTDGLFLVANESELWRVDSNGEGASLVSDRFQSIDRLAVVGDDLYVTGKKDDVENGLWRVNPVDGAAEFLASFANLPTYFGTTDKRLFFTVRNTSVTEVWTVDGDEATRIADLDASVYWSNGSITGDLFIPTERNPVVGYRYFLVLQTGPVPRQLQLWATDGSEESSAILAEFEGDGLRGRPVFINEARTHLALDAIGGFVISDGTAAGTRILDGQGSLAAAGNRNFYVTLTQETRTHPSASISKSSTIAKMDPVASLLTSIDDSRTFALDELASNEMHELNGNLVFRR